MKSCIVLCTFLLALTAAGETVVRCRDTACSYYLQDVGPTHQHFHRCQDPACVNFQQFAPLNHRHLHRNQDVTNPNYQQFVPRKPSRRR